MKNIKYYFFIIYLILIVGCQTTNNYYKKNIFINKKIELLYPGMPLAKFVQLFGQPDIKYKMEFGENISNKWKGLVYKYFTIRDKKYKYTKKYLTNTFIFLLGQEPKLNSWNIEYLYDDIKQNYKKKYIVIINNNKYGPVDKEIVDEWYKENRLNNNTIIIEVNSGKILKVEDFFIK